MSYSYASGLAHTTASIDTSGATAPGRRGGFAASAGQIGSIRPPPNGDLRSAWFASWAYRVTEKRSRTALATDIWASREEVSICAIVASVSPARAARTTHK